MAQNEIKRRGTARVAFRAMRDQVATRIETGATLIMIWEEFFGRETPPRIGYKHFTDLVAREIPERTTGKRRGAAAAQPASSLDASPATTAKPLQEPPAAGEQDSDYAPIGSSEWRRRHGVPEPRRETRNVFVPRHIDLREAFFGREPDKEDE